MGDKLIAVDPTDMRAVLKESGGRGAIGIGEASGPNRALEAAKLAMRDLERAIALARLKEDRDKLK
jgi:cell division GTPase FtsZ